MSKNDMQRRRRQSLGGALALLLLAGAWCATPVAAAELPPLQGSRYTLQSGSFSSAGGSAAGGTYSVLSSSAPVEGRLGNPAPVDGVGFDLGGFLYTLDVTAPLALVDEPALCHNAQNINDIQILGRASDRRTVAGGAPADPQAPENGMGLRRVEIALQDAESGQHYDEALGGQGGWTGSVAWKAVSGLEDWLVDPARIRSWRKPYLKEQSGWRLNTAYVLKLRALDKAGNLFTLPSDEQPLFAYHRMEPFSKVDAPVAGESYNSDTNQLCEVAGRACSGKRGDLDGVELRFQVVTTTKPGQDDRYLKFWDPAVQDWVSQETWFPADGANRWSYGTDPACGGAVRVPFECDPTVADCGHAVRVTSRATQDKNPKHDEEVGNSVNFYVDIEAPVAEQVSPAGDGTALHQLLRITGVARDCGTALPDPPDPAVEVGIVRMRWDETSGSFEEDGTWWQGGQTWSPTESWHGAAVDRNPDLYPWVPCHPDPARWSYTWVLGQEVEAENGYHYQVKFRAKDIAGNILSASNGYRFHFDDMAPAAPPNLQAVNETTGTAIFSGVWQNVTGAPLFTWDEPFDDCDPADAACPLDCDPDDPACVLKGTSRFSSGISGYVSYYGPDPAGLVDEDQPILDRDYDTGADPGQEGTSYFHVHAIDEAGNIGAESRFEVLYEATPPLIRELTVPRDGSVIYRDGFPEIRGRAGDEGSVQSEVDKVEIRLRNDTTGEFWSQGSLQWVSAETWYPADVTIRFPDGDVEFSSSTTVVPLDFLSVYTVSTRSLDLAGNVSPVVSNSFTVDRLHLLDPDLASGPAPVEFWDDYKITLKIESPLTEQHTATIRAREDIDAKTMWGVGFPVTLTAPKPPVQDETDLPTWAIPLWEPFFQMEVPLKNEYSFPYDYSGDPADTTQQTLTWSPSQTREITFSYDHYWRWLAPTEDADLWKECVANGIIDSFVMRIPPAIDTVSQVYELMQELARYATSLYEVDFLYDFQSDRSIQDLEVGSDGWSTNVNRSQTVKVPWEKVFELSMGTFMQILAEIKTELAQLALLTHGNVPVFAVAQAAEAYSITGACLAYQSAADPDPDYEVLVFPTYVPIEEVTTHPAILNDAWNRDTVQRQMDIVSNEKAMYASRNKFWGAKEAGDAFWMEKQSAAMRLYADLAREGRLAVAAKYDRLVHLFEETDIELTDARIEESRADIRDNGLPPVEQDILRYHGFTTEGMDRISREFGKVLPKDEVRRIASQLGDYARMIADLIPRSVLLYWDDFDDQDRDGWIVLSGDWDLPSLAAGVKPDYLLEGRAAAGTARIVTEETFSGEHEVIVDTRMSGNAVSVLWNVQDASNYYELVVGAGLEDGIQAFVVENGSRRPLGPVFRETRRDAGWNRIRVATEEGRHAFYVDTQPDPDVPELEEPWLWGEVSDTTFSGGAIGLGVEIGEGPSLFDNVAVKTTSDGARGSWPSLAVSVVTPDPRDIDPVTFTVEAPAGATNVRLFVDGQEAQSWSDQGGTLTWTGGPFGTSCEHTFRASAVTSDGLLLSAPLESSDTFATIDTTPPFLEALQESIVVKATRCEDGTGWVDWNPWTNTNFSDFCDPDPSLTPPSDPGDRYFLGPNDVSVSATDASGNAGSLTFEAVVISDPPEIEPLSLGGAVENAAVALSATAFDPTSDSLTFTWSWGDGTADTVQVQGVDRGDPIVPLTDLATHTYGDNGVFPVTLTVTNECGSSATATTEVTVRNAHPVIDESSIRATVRADLTVKVAGPEGVMVKERLDPKGQGPRHELVYLEGFTAEVYVFQDDQVLASAVLAEEEGVSPESVTLPGLELDMGREQSVRIAYSTDLDDDAVAWVELRFEDGSVRTLEHRFPAALGMPGEREPRLLDETHAETWRAAMNQLAAGSVGEAETDLSLRVRGAGEQLREGRLEFVLFEDGSEVGSRVLEIAPYLKDLKRDKSAEFQDLDGDRLPDEYRLTLEDLLLSPDSQYRSEVAYSDSDEVLDPAEARIVPDGRPEDLFHFFVETRAPERCDRPEGEVCISSDWQEVLDTLLFGIPVTLEATAVDEGSDDLEFTWNWGDGTAPGVRIYFNDGAGPDPFPSPEINPILVTDSQVHRFVGSDAYEISLEVRDDDGGVDVVNLAVALLLTGNQDPAVDPASLAWTESLEDAKDRNNRDHWRHFVTVDLQASDADSDALTFTWSWGDGETEIRSYRFDGNPSEGAPFAVTASARHDYEEAGTYAVTVAVEDESGGVDTFAFEVVTVGNEGKKKLRPPSN